MLARTTFAEAIAHADAIACGNPEQLSSWQQDSSLPVLLQGAGHDQQAFNDDQQAEAFFDHAVRALQQPAGQVDAQIELLERDLSRSNTLSADQAKALAHGAVLDAAAAAGPMWRREKAALQQHISELEAQLTSSVRSNRAGRTQTGSVALPPPDPNPAMAASSRGPALLAAALTGDEAALQRLLERARRPAQLLKTTDEQGCTALHLAADAGHEGCMHLCLKAGADVSVADEGGYTPLSIACLYGHTDCARLLLEAGAIVDAAMEDGATPLLIACQKGHTDCARLCLEAGANTEAAMDDGGTPLFVACQHGHLDCARLCLDAGANVDAALKEGGATPLFAACQDNHTDCAHLLLEAAGEC